jgi:hypothetical protein
MRLIPRNSVIHPQPSIELLTQRSKVQILPPQPFRLNELRISDQPISQFANKLRKPKDDFHHFFPEFCPPPT